MPDASDTTLRRKLQALATNRVVIQETISAGIINRSLLSGRPGAIDESDYILYREAPSYIEPVYEQNDVSDDDGYEQEECVCNPPLLKVARSSTPPLLAHPLKNMGYNAIRVALIGSAFVSSYAAALQSAYLTVSHPHTLHITCFDMNNFDGVCLRPDTYDAIALYAPTVPAFHPDFGESLNAYMAAGGNSVLTQFLFGDANVIGIPGFDYSYTPITYNTAFAVINPETYCVPVGIHPITDGVDTYMNLDAANIGKPIVLQEGGAIIATFTDRLDTPFIIVKTDGHRRSVAVNRYPRDPALFTDTVYNQLIVNSIVWASGIV